MRFKDRKDAGIKMAEALAKYQKQDVVVLALPRGGVVPAAEIAKALSAPLDLVITKKIGHPRNDEYAICAISEDGEPVCNEIEMSRVDPKWLEKKIEKIRSEIQERRENYQLGNTRQSLEGKTVIVVDDGIATGLTMLAAIYEIKSRNPKELVVAIPVVPVDVAGKIKALVDDMVALDIDPAYLGAVGAYYDNFLQVEDNEVIAILKEVARKGGQRNEKSE